MARPRSLRPVTPKWPRQFDFHATQFDLLSEEDCRDRRWAGGRLVRAGDRVGEQVGRPSRGGGSRLPRRLISQDRIPRETVLRAIADLDEE